MRRKGPQRGRTIPLFAAWFAAGCVAGWVTHAEMARKAEGDEASPRHRGEAIVAAEPEAAGTAAPLPNPATEAKDDGSTIEREDAVAELQHRHLRVPIDGARLGDMKGQFAATRGGGKREHEAVDILAPRGTPVRAVEAGTIAKLFQSRIGGTTIYEFDPTGRFCYYYAHLQRYAEDLREGLRVEAGDVIGYVGTTGNASPNAPHLHFAVFELTPEKQWWKGRPIDPYLVFKG